MGNSRAEKAKPPVILEGGEVSRVVDLREAVAGLVRDGDSVALEGFTHLIPFAAAHEIIRQEKRNLTLIRMTPDLVYDWVQTRLSCRNPATSHL